MMIHFRPCRSAVFLLLSSLLLSPAFARADSVKARCPDLEKCALAVSELTGEKFVYDAIALKGPIQATPNFELTKENADEIFTQMLDQNGFSRVPLSEPNAYTILRSRDARDSALPLLTADAKTTPSIPKTWDIATLRYKLTQPELAEHLTRNARSFMPANWRIIPDETSGQLILVAPYPILAHVLGLLQSMDVKVTPAQLKKLEGRRTEARESEHRAAAAHPLPENAPPH